MVPRLTVPARFPCHLDPDLAAESGPEVPGCQAAFGQVGAAQRHLDYELVGRGDLFLFFGWFCEVQQVEGTWRYRLLGWLQVGEVVRVGERWTTWWARRRASG